MEKEHVISLFVPNRKKMALALILFLLSTFLSYGPYSEGVQMGFPLVFHKDLSSNLPCEDDCHISHYSKIPLELITLFIIINFLLYYLISVVVFGFSRNR